MIGSKRIWGENYREPEGSMLKRFVCLAKSAREGGFCIAGKEILANGVIGNWFRPIGRSEEALPTADCKLFKIGDVVACEVSNYVPSHTQPENYKVAQHPSWRIINTFPVQHFETLLDFPLTLWGTGCSSYHGRNDRIFYENASQFGNSLYFIKIDGATITKNDESFDGSTRFKMRLTFIYNNVDYCLIITDPKLSTPYWNRLQAGESTQIGPNYLTISLAMPYNNYCYKLVAGYVSI